MGRRLRRVLSTLLTEAAVRFQSETIIETFPAAGPVKTEIIGAIDKLKEEAAERVRDDMNFKLTEEMPEYRPEHERMLYNLGSGRRRVQEGVFRPSVESPELPFLYRPKMSSSLTALPGIRTAERATHVMRKTKNDSQEAAGLLAFTATLSLGEPVSRSTQTSRSKRPKTTGFSLTDDDRYQILGNAASIWTCPATKMRTAVALPYVITIDRATNQKCWPCTVTGNEDDERQAQEPALRAVRPTCPASACTVLAYIHIIGGYARAGTSIIRQLVDAGTLSNLPGGLKSRGLRIKGDDTPIAPGEFRDVDVPSGYRA